MKNNISDLHNHLFTQLERLNDLDEDEMKSDVLVNEIKRAEAINKIASSLINNGRLVLDAVRLKAENPDIDIELPEVLDKKKVLLPPGKK